MKNLIKNVIRSFKNNKLSIIGLVLLLFFGLGVFCVMSNTTANITNEYTSLAKKGNLHDLTVSELYDVGKAEYNADGTKVVSYTVSGDQTTFYKYDDYSELDTRVPVSQFYFNNQLADQDGTYYVLVPEQTYYVDPNTGAVYVTRTYSIALDQDLSVGLYSNYAKDHAGTGFVEFKYVVRQQFDSTIDVPTNVASLNDILSRWESSTATDWETLADNSIYAADYHDFNAFIANETSGIYSLMTTGNTPLAGMLDENYANELYYRYFKSVNVTASGDNVFYKIINSNPEDEIDKMVLFKDPNGRYGNDLYSVNDWAPYNSQVQFQDHNGNLVAAGTQIKATEDLTFVVPSNFTELAELPLYDTNTMSSWSTEQDAAYIYSQIIHIRFKRMLSGDFEKTDNKPIIESVAAINQSIDEYNTNLFNGSIPYNTYYSDIYRYTNEMINISANGNVVLTWTDLLGSPTTLTISNWTSKLSIINPQHLSKTSHRVIAPKMLNEFEPYKQWFYQTYKSYPSGEIDAKASKDWFNTLTSDQFNWWVNPNTKKAEWATMRYDLPNGEHLDMERSTTKDATHWNGIDKKYIASCSGYDEIIWGCGLTPDFMYPVVDISRPTPNTATECLVYTNDSGYNSIKLSFVNSPVEDYLVARFKPSVNTIRRQEILKEINHWATGERTSSFKPAMIYPEGTKVAFFANDTSNVLNCSGFRIAYIPSLVSVVQTVSTVLCAFIGILCLIICFVIIKRYVENNRINIGIMRANGIKKWKIALSLFPFALLPAVIGGIGAYVVGLLMQGPMLLLFSNYWMLPTPLFGFDWVSFLVCIFAPFLLFTIICFVSTFVVLRTSAVSLMKAGSEFKTNGFSRIAKKPFKHFGVLTRFRVSLAFNSITRLLILAAMSCLTMSSLVFAMTTFDKLSQSKNINSTQFNYDFNVELTTPTSSGGPYSIYDYSQPIAPGSDQIKGYGWADPEQYLFNVNWNTSNEDYHNEIWYTEDGQYSYHQFTKPYEANGFIGSDATNAYKNAIGMSGLLMLPSSADAEGQQTDLMYLQNRHSSRLTLNYDIGIPGIASSNPWEIALAMMPANSRNLAADAFNELTNIAGKKVHEAEEIYRAVYPVSELYPYRDDYQRAMEAQRLAGPYCKLYDYGVLIYDYEPCLSSFFTEHEDEESHEKTYTLNTDTFTISEIVAAIPPIVRFNPNFVYLLKTIYQDPELLKMEYPIEYGAIPLNWDRLGNDKLDETYTYINGYIKNLSSRAGYDKNHLLKVEGIKQDSKYIFLTDKNGHALNERLWSDNYLQANSIDNETTYPIIINAYVAHKYKLGVGSTLTINTVNDVNRYLDDYNPDDHLIKFKVVGVSVGTNNEAYYTRQDIANNLLGLPNGNAWNRTHKYMMWYRSASSWDGSPNDTLPSLVDLSGIDPETGIEGQNISVYNFSNGSYIPEGKHYVIDNSTQKLPQENIPVPTGFNGVYTHNKNGKPITAGLSLYSYTGLYPGTSVFKSQSAENKFSALLKYGPNLAIANIMTGIDDQDYYNACYNHLLNGTEISDDVINEFIDKITEIYGGTTMITAICGAIDVAATDLIYNNLISTFNLAETTIMAIIIPITIIIVAVISNLIINDSRRMAAMLKALGYSDIKNLMSILALFIPTIVLGLALAVPLSFGLTLGYQSIIFNTANILVDVTQKWWYYVAAIGGIGIILIGTYAIGYVSLKRSRLVDEIK
ncbi:MAG: FtsX-like permease family protein [Mycoplasmoidaceae bacterium]